MKDFIRIMGAMFLGIFGMVGLSIGVIYIVPLISWFFGVGVD